MSITYPRQSVIGYTGPSSDPQEIRLLRSTSMEFHETLGQLVIHKHRWNDQDVANGLAQVCPFHDDTYERDPFDLYCFGTGILGGYADGTLTPVTFGDVQEDLFRPNAQGILIHERHPGLTAPWIPDMGDADLIIVVEVNNNGGITEIGDRFELREVNPVTMRGPGFHNTKHMKLFKVNQEAMIDLLPFGHPLYQVPVNFDYNNVPDVVPPGVIVPPGYSYAHHEVNVRLFGEDLPPAPPESSLAVNVGVQVAGTTVTQQRGVGIIGAPGGTHINFEAG